MTYTVTKKQVLKLNHKLLTLNYGHVKIGFKLKQSAIFYLSGSNACLAWHKRKISITGRRSGSRSSSDLNSKEKRNSKGTSNRVYGHTTLSHKIKLLVTFY